MLRIPDRQQVRFMVEYHQVYHLTTDGGYTSYGREQFPGSTLPHHGDTRDHIGPTLATNQCLRRLYHQVASKQWQSKGQSDRHTWKQASDAMKSSSIPFTQTERSIRDRMVR